MSFFILIYVWDDKCENDSLMKKSFAFVWRTYRQSGQTCFCFYCLHCIHCIPSSHCLPPPCPVLSLSVCYSNKPLYLDRPGQCLPSSWYSDTCVDAQQWKVKSVCACVRTATVFCIFSLKQVNKLSCTTLHTFSNNWPQNHHNNVNEIRLDARVFFL